MAVLEIHRPAVGQLNPKWGLQDVQHAALLINLSSRSISSQLPKMSSSTVGMWLDDEAFGC